MLTNEIIIRRLALIKFLFNKGVETAYQVETIAGFSILSFHDCIEMFLILAAQHKGLKNIKKFSFMEFWSQIPELTLGNQMEALKDRRVSIKHNFQFPSKQDIEISRITATEFLIENTRIIFNLDFNAISMADLIGSDKVRLLIKSAEQKLCQNEIFNSLCDSRNAFYILFSDYESNKSQFEHWRSEVNIGKKIGSDYKKLIGTDRNSGYEWFREVSDTINELREVLKLTGLGVDYRKYVFFDIVTPRMYLVCKKDSPGVEARFETQSDYEYRKHLNKENAQFCINFIIECSLKLQDFDFDRSQVFKTSQESEIWFQEQQLKHQQS